ncbi:MAG: hypothetical protein WC027_01750 [Candidatus Paceibacterota bacterium]
MESFKIENKQEECDILDPNQMYDDFINQQDKTKWEYSKIFDEYVPPDEVKAEFIREFLQRNSFRHFDIYKYCETHPGFFSNTLSNYYRDFIMGNEMPDIIRKSFNIRANEIESIFHKVIINGIEVTPKEKLVKFPERLIKETGGVEGYLRKELTWKEINDIFSQILSINEIKEIIELYIENLDKNFSLDEDIVNFRKLNSIDSLESFDNYHTMIYFIRNNILKADHYVRYKNKSLDELEENIWKIISTLKNIIDILGNSFFKKENIHVMSLYHGPGFESFSDKILMQKIFDPEVGEAVRSDGTKDYGYTVFSSIGPNGEISEIDRIVSDDPGDYKKLQTYIEDGNFLIHGFGLSVQKGGIWNLDRDKSSPLSVFDNFNRPMFGFSEGNATYNRYIESVKKLFDQQDGVLKKAVVASPDNPFYFKTNPPHPLIPIVISHPNIPDLRWCNSSHAYIPTKNGISVLKMISSKKEMEDERNRLENNNTLEENPYLHSVSEGKIITIGPTSGKKTIAKAKDLFPRYIDEDFINYGTDIESEERPATPVHVLEMINDGLFQQIFSGFGVDLDRLCFTQDQIIEFCEKKTEHLHPYKWMTYFLFKVGDEFFVAGVDRYNGGPEIYIYRLSDKLTRLASRRERVVIPQPGI